MGLVPRQGQDMKMMKCMGNLFEGCYYWKKKQLAILSPVVWYCYCLLINIEWRHFIASCNLLFPLTSCCDTFNDKDFHLFMLYITFWSNSNAFAVIYGEVIKNLLVKSTFYGSSTRCIVIQPREIQNMHQHTNDTSLWKSSIAFSALIILFYYRWTETTELLQFYCFSNYLWFFGTAIFFTFKHYLSFLLLSILSHCLSKPYLKSLMSFVVAILQIA